MAREEEKEAKSMRGSGAQNYLMSQTCRILYRKDISPIRLLNVVN